MIDKTVLNQEHARGVIDGIVRSTPLLQASQDQPSQQSCSSVESLEGPPFPAAAALMIRAYALPESAPKRLQFDQHLLRFNGLSPQERNQDLIWGVCGTEAMGRANAYAAMDAQRAGRRLYQIDLWYRVRRREHEDWMRPLTAEVIRKNGFLQFQRVDADYRDYLRSIFLERLQEIDDPRLEELRLESSLEALVAERPMLVHWLMRMCPWICAVQHTVYIGSGVSLRIATLRRDVGRFLHVSTRYHPEIETVVQA